MLILWLGERNEEVTDIYYTYSRLRRCEELGEVTDSELGKDYSGMLAGCPG